MKCVARRRLICTEDGSSSLQLTDFDEQFHSLHGAYSESMHIYINAGLQSLPPQGDFTVLEMGLGTGLNALLTWQYACDRRMHYHGIEAYPLVDSEWSSLEFPQMESPVAKDFFFKLHACREGEWVPIDERFVLKKEFALFEKVNLLPAAYNLVYFDAFSPDVQPELWSRDVFEKVYVAMKAEGILVTYCAKGVVKRLLKSVGFLLETLPGPKGKREITRCVKK